MKFKQNKGITIVALVTTIILMLILAGISIQSMTNTGIFGSTRRAELENKRGQVTEYLSLKLLNQQMLNPTGATEDIVTATRTSIVKKELEQIGKKAEIGEISKEENFKQVQVYFYVTVDDDIYKVEATGISFVGNKEEMSPVIKIVKMSNTTNSVTVEVETLYNEGGKLEYYIKGEQDTDYKLIKTTTDKSYTFEGLEQEKQYSVKVKAIAKNKKTAEVIGQQTTGKVAEITTADTTFISAPKIWTNTDVTVTVSTTVTGFTLQTSMDGKTWSNETSQTFTENGTIYARLFDGTNGGKALSSNVTNIDKLVPKDFTPTATSTTNSLTVTASTEDADATKENGKSEIAGYRFKLDNGNWTAYQESGTYTWNNLTQTTEHTITVEAKDNAGNTKEGTVSKGTGTVTTLTTANTTFTYTPEQEKWTNGSVTATVSTTVTGFTLQTSTNGKDWSNKTSQTFTENGKIYARLWDGTNEGTALSGNVTNIDKLAPKDFTPTATSTTNSLTVTASATDADATTAYGNSGIAGYRFKLDSGSWTNYQASGTYTWNSLAQTTNHTITVEAKDNAGNTKQGTVSKGTGTVTTLTTANTTFTYTPAQGTWTTGSVTATVSTTVTGFTLQTSKDAKTWSNETSQIFTTNGYIYARLWDGTNESPALSGNVTNIDKLAPKDFTPTATSTTNSITVTASATDADATTAYGKSGIAGYRFKLDSGSWTNYQTSGTYTWNSLAQSTDHTITVEAKDNAGNTKQGTVSKGTGTVEKPTTATYTPTGWTNGNVTVTLPTKQGYTTRYTTNGTAPTKTSTAYSAPFTVSNNCVVTYIYTDGTNIGGSNTANIKNIDKTAPSSFTIAKSTVGVNSFTLSATFSDSNSGLGKIVWYYKRPQDSSWQSATDTYTAQNSTTAGTIGSVTKTKEITGLTKGGTVQAYAIGYDVAGNSKTTTNATSGSPLSFNTSTYTISYNANGGSGAPGNQSKYYGVNITLSSTKPTRSEYTFLGWSTSNTATSASYASGASYSGNSNTTLYAVWQYHTHSYTAQGNLRSSATCTAAATYWYKCSICGTQGSTYFSSGSALGHSYTAQGNLRSSATCTAAATYWYKCSRCGTQGSNYFSSGGTISHDYSAQGNLRTAANCGAAATYWYKCSMCGAQGSTYFSSGSPSGSHDRNIVMNSTDTCPWCGQTSKRVSYTCSKCGALSGLTLTCPLHGVYYNY